MQILIKVDISTFIEICKNNNNMTTDQLNNIIKLKHAETICKAFNDTCERYEINTPLRQSHFLAQILHESSGLAFTKELASGQAYEGRKDLGNINPGDGQKYKGRGLIQLTGRDNYSLLSKAFGIDFIKNPERLEQLPYSMLSAGWFWHVKKLNKWADLDDVFEVSKRINGINSKTKLPNGYEERKLWLEKCKKAFMI